MTARRAKPAGCCTEIVEPLPFEQPDGGRADDRLVAGFKALGDPTRFAIFRLIAAQSEPICVCDVTDRFDLSQPTISHHLKALREAGLVTVSRRGVWAYYAAEPNGVARLRDALDALAAPARPALVAVG